MARHLGTEHTRLYVTADETREVIPALPTLYDEPFADSSAIPTFLVSQLARRHVTVSLSGDGGDELFRWLRLVSTARRASGGAYADCQGSYSAPARRVLSGLARGGPHAEAAQFREDVPAHGSRSAPKLASLLGRSAEPEDVHWSLLSKWDGCPPVVLRVDRTPSTPPDWLARPLHGDVARRLMLTDLLTYLPGDILAKVDRASMGVSLEARAPFLDHRVVEFAARLPTDPKLRHGNGKWLLRQVLDRYVPRTLIDRPKMGFRIPVGAWLRGPLRGWAEELLEDGQLRQQGFSNPAQIRRKWDEHLSGTRDWEDHLWHALMFQAWLAA